jgi:hypothetical protein
MTRRFPGRVSLTVIERAERPVAFTFGLAHGAIYHNLFSGLDYAANDEGHLLFNLFYADLGFAFRHGYRSIDLGTTADDFKCRLGPRQERLYYLVKLGFPYVPARVVHWLFPPFAGPFGSRNVFRSQDDDERAGAPPRARPDLGVNGSHGCILPSHRASSGSRRGSKLRGHHEPRR